MPLEFRIDISVIISTRNRAPYLEKALESIIFQGVETMLYEIIVVDNGSVDDTKQVVERLNKKFGERVRYCYASSPGLHVARHAGAKIAKGKILTFTDDDIIASPEWLENIWKTFSSTDAGIVGGKILPKWEGVVPRWIDIFRHETNFGWAIGYLSLIDFGDVRKEIPGKFVFGCNFSILRDTLFGCGGFHPDAMPRELIRYRGDGETALAKTVQAKGHKIYYEPKAIVSHRIPPERLTVDYFCHRAFQLGISDSYTRIRFDKGINQYQVDLFISKANLAARLKKLSRKYFSTRIFQTFIWRHILYKVARSYREGFYYHQQQTSENPELMEHVLQKTYL